MLKRFALVVGVTFVMNALAPLTLIREVNTRKILCSVLFVGQTIMQSKHKTEDAMCYNKYDEYPDPEDSWPKDGQRCVFEHVWGQEVTEFFNDGKMCWGYELIDVELEPGFEFIEDDELTAFIRRIPYSELEDMGIYKLQEFDYYVTTKGNNLLEKIDAYVDAL